jgi:hypothetical protein
MSSEDDELAGAEDLAVPSFPSIPEKSGGSSMPDVSRGADPKAKNKYSPVSSARQFSHTAEVPQFSKKRLARVQCRSKGILHGKSFWAMISAPTAFYNTIGMASSKGSLQLHDETKSTCGKQ